MKRCGASGPTVETQHDFGLGATGLLAPPGPFKALARTGPTVEKWLMKPDEMRQKMRRQDYMRLPEIRREEMRKDN